MAPSAPPPAPAPLDPLDARTLRQLKDLGGDDDPDFLPSVMRAFLAHLTGAVRDVAAAARAGDAPAVKRVAHSLKGGAGNVGARGLSTSCAAMEAAALGGADLAGPLAALLAEAERVRARVEDELAGERRRG